MTLNDEDPPPATPTTGKAGTEAKVKAATVSGAAIAAVILTVLSVAQTDHLFAGLPDWVTVLLGVVIAGLGTWGAGYQADHTARRDLPMSRR